MRSGLVLIWKIAHVQMPRTCSSEGSFTKVSTDRETTNSEENLLQWTFKTHMRKCDSEVFMQISYMCGKD